MKRLLTASVVLGFVAVLSACATPNAAGGPAPVASATPETDGGVKAGIELDAAWLDGGRMIAIVTAGSTSCAPMGDAIGYADGVLEVAFVESPEDAACTNDIASRATLVALPEGVDPTKDLEIHVTGAEYVGETDLDGVAGLVGGGETDYTPSAGWLDADGQFVVVTWGSSSCLPVLQDAAATGPSEVTVTFQTPDAEGQVCTMDMAPRGLVVTVAGLEEDANTTLVLTGGGVDARTKILGSD